MDLTFWLGILLGFIGSVILWYITTKVLTPRLSVSTTLEMTRDPAGGLRYRFSLRNESHRDAVDVIVKCTLFSEGWASGPPDEIATIDIPVSVGQIDVMPGRRYFWSSSKSRLLDRVGDRFVTLYVRDISEFQKSKLNAETQRQLKHGEIGLKELLDLGRESFVNVVVYGFDRFSGSRNVYSERYFRNDDIRFSR
jgi:hypothetical protein